MSFEVGLYEVLIHSQCITDFRCWLAHPQFGGAGRSTPTEAKQCAAVDTVAANCIFAT